MRLTKILAIILAIIGIIAAFIMAADYYYRPPLPLSDPRSDTMGNVQGSIYYFFPLVLAYAALAWFYMKNAYRVAWYYLTVISLLAWAAAAGAFGLAFHRGGVEALFMWYTIIVAIFCSLAAIILPFISNRSH